MANNNELKPVSYRIDDETKDKIKKIADELQLNQQGTLQKLIEAFEIQNDKSKVSDPGKRDIIENFEFYTSKINQSFISIVQGLQDADEKAEMKVMEKLQSKDMTIQDLQEKVTTAKQLQEEATAKSKEFANRSFQLEKDIQELNNQIDSMNKQIDTYKSSNEALTLSLALANEKSKANEEAANNYSNALKELEKAKKEVEEKHNIILQMEERHKTAVDMLKYNHDAELKQMEIQKQLDINTAVENERLKAQEKIDLLKNDYEARITKLNNETSSRVDNYQDKLEKANEKLEDFRDKMQCEIDKYKKMYEALEAQIDSMK